MNSRQYENKFQELITLKGHSNLLIGWLFILGSILYSSINGFFSLIMGAFIGESYKILLFLFAVISS
jgi:hypothetical protein